MALPGPTRRGVSTLESGAQPGFVERERDACAGRARYQRAGTTKAGFGHGGARKLAPSRALPQRSSRFSPIDSRGRPPRTALQRRCASWLGSNQPMPSGESTPKRRLLDRVRHLPRVQQLVYLAVRDTRAPRSMSTRRGTTLRCWPTPGGTAGLDLGAARRPRTRATTTSVASTAGGSSCSRRSQRCSCCRSWHS